jgi:excinuclease ABC subunit A
MYSQVTIDVLNQVCEAEGFSVDIPWQDLTDEQRDIILNGSDKIKVPFGKYSLESRLKWTGIKAKPREEGFYKGMLPIMSDILRRDRNANILKYVHAITCEACKGKRLTSEALNVRVHGKSIAEVVPMELNELKAWILLNEWETVGLEIVTQIKTQIELLEDLGLGHLTLDRRSKTLRASEIQRIRVANQILAPLSNVLYVFDEPSIGLHAEETERLIYHFKQLVKKGNTVIVVEHDLKTITNAEHIIEIGPKAGVNGGEVIYNGPFSEFRTQSKLEERSPTYRALTSSVEPIKRSSSVVGESIHLIGCHERNLKHIDVQFQLGKLNVVSGKSGTGKSSLIKGTLVKAVQQQLGIEFDGQLKLTDSKHIELINKLICIDHSPIGKTPRSNPATYLGISDHIRDLYSSLPEAKEKKFTKTRFSFNTKGGRCETCQGAGKLQIGMHFLGNVDLICDTCNGDRFNVETLQLKYNGLSIADVYKLSIHEAISFFENETSAPLSMRKKVVVGLTLLKEIGLGYLTLGQSSTTLSGGEAQRIKIANQLQKKDTGDTLFVIIEPTIGLHHDDIKSLLLLFDRIKQKGNTIVCIEQNETVINWSDWHIELGPTSGMGGGEVNHQGIPQLVNQTENNEVEPKEPTVLNMTDILLNGVTTHGLKNINVRIPKNQLTVVTGVSGSGKSSLVYDTLFAESNARFTESLSTYNRSFLQQNSEAKLESFSGIGPAIGINRSRTTPSKRSTVGTLSGIYDTLRLLYSRIAQHEGLNYTAQHFSFNHHLGACPECNGVGLKLKCDPDEVIIAPNKSILDGAISSNKAISYYSDANGQFMATLKEVAKQNNWDMERPWCELEKEVQYVILYGTGDTIWNVKWEFTTKLRTGTQDLSVKWLGLCEYIDEEYQRKQSNKNITTLEAMLHAVECPICKGSRLKPELLETNFLGKNIYELSQLSIQACLELIENIEGKVDEVVLAISEVVLPTVIESLEIIIQLGLGYLNLNRPVSTLSGGERQRITLAGQLSSHLFGVTYVLDEPTIGLDAVQIDVLSTALKQIVANGNTVVVVEHDISFIQTADYIIEMGPGAGALGGEVIYQGTVTDIAKATQTLTYQLINHTDNNQAKKPNTKGDRFGLTGAAANNLKDISVDLNSGQIIAITGVSGSGKSTLIKDVLYTSWVKNRPVNCQSVYGLEQFQDVMLIGQDAVTQNRLSTPVTYTGIIDQLKAIFFKTEVGQTAGFKKADFSYQSKVGKCPLCAGHGKLKTSMDFMSDIWLPCDSCKGMRFSPSILDCTYKGKSIGEVLELTVQEAIDFFEAGVIIEKLNVLKRLGLGHLVLGQSATTLSGGEGQRLKLATALLKTKKGNTLYLFDEPSTGLHYYDILELINVFQSLIDQGDTVLFIEHNSTLIDAAGQVITLGPGSGEEGGELI